MSFLRSYKEHLCNYIFLFKNLNLGRLAVAFGLLRLPKMPELKDMTVEKFIPEEIDVRSICVCVCVCVCAEIITIIYAIFAV